MKFAENFLKIGNYPTGPLPYGPPTAGARRTPWSGQAWAAPPRPPPPSPNLFFCQRASFPLNAHGPLQVVCDWYICFSKRVQLFFEALFSQFEFEESFVHEFELSFDFRHKTSGYLYSDVVDTADFEKNQTNINTTVGNRRRNASCGVFIWNSIKHFSGPRGERRRARAAGIISLAGRLCPSSSRTHTRTARAWSVTRASGVGWIWSRTSSIPSRARRSASLKTRSFSWPPVATRPRQRSTTWPSSAWSYVFSNSELKRIFMDFLTWSNFYLFSNVPKRNVAAKNRSPMPTGIGGSSENHFLKI